MGGMPWNEKRFYDQTACELASFSGWNSDIRVFYEGSYHISMEFQVLFRHRTLFYLWIYPDSVRSHAGEEKIGIGGSASTADTTRK